MYKLSIEMIDGTREQHRGSLEQLNILILNNPEIIEYWVEDEAGNTHDHWKHEQDEEVDGQPDEYTEWQDYMGGDDWDHGQYDDGGY